MLLAGLRDTPQGQEEGIISPLKDNKEANWDCSRERPSWEQHGERYPPEGWEAGGRRMSWDTFAIDWLEDSLSGYKIG